MHHLRDRVAAAFLLSPGGAGPAEVPPPTLVFAEDRDFAGTLTQTERSLVDLIHVRTLEVLAVLRAQALPGVETADHTFLARLAAGSDFSFLAEPVPVFPGPVLILSGRQDPAGYQHLFDLLAACPRGTRAILDRTGHLLFAEQPALLAALTAEWLDRVEEHLRS